VHLHLLINLLSRQESELKRRYSAGTAKPLAHICAFVIKKVKYIWHHPTHTPATCNIPFLALDLAIG
jgi:hypothetical protein